MQSRFYTPHVLLQDFVQCIMVVHVEADPDGPTPVCLYPPTPQGSLFFYIDDPIRVQPDGLDAFLVQPRSVVVGQQSKPVMLDIGRSHKAVRVGFHPGGMHRLLGLSMHEMLDGSYDAVDVLGAEVQVVNDRLQEASDADAIHRIIEAFLLRKANGLTDALPFDHAMIALMRSHGSLSMEETAALACLGIRQFERLSHTRVGMSPKLFARLIRFSKAYRLYQESPGVRWTDIAYRCGYFDQMHMIRDFKAFAGISPGGIERELERLPVRLQINMRL